VVLPVLQGPLRGTKWIAGSSDNGCWLGSYEYHKQHAFARSISAGDVVIDCGAHVGFYTLLASSLVGRAGRVIALEPVTENIAYLSEHLRLNHIENVTVIEAAVSNQDDSVRFRSGPGSTMGCISDEGEYTVRALQLDSLLPCLETTSVAVIKMDIEGGEFRALQGAKVLLTKHQPKIFLATHGSEVHRDCCEYLLSLGYELSAVTGESVWETDEILAVPRTSQEINRG
jgi:FkbM family methyltransferase